MNAFSNKKNLESHEEYCLKKKEANIDMPEKGTFIEFKNHNRSIKVPFLVYADFESLIQSISGAELDARVSFTNQISKHEPSGFCCGRPEEPAILISTLVLRMRGMYVARSWPNLCGLPLRMNGMNNTQF